MAHAIWTTYRSVIEKKNNFICKILILINLKFLAMSYSPQNLRVRLQTNFPKFRIYFLYFLLTYNNNFLLHEIRGRRKTIRVLY